MINRVVAMCFVAIALCSGNLHGQPGLKWKNLYYPRNDNQPLAITEAHNGGWIFAGVSDSRAWVARLDDQGQVQWQKNYGDSIVDFNSNVFTSIIKVRDGYLLGGETLDPKWPGYHGFVTYYGDTAFARHDGLIVKIDTVGNVLWSQCYGGLGGDIITSLTGTSDGDIAFAGNTLSKEGDFSNFHGTFNTTLPDLWVGKIDSVEGLLWEKVYGGTGYEGAVSITELADHSLLVGATAGSHGNGGGDVVSGPIDGSATWLLRLDREGLIKSQEIFCPQSSAPTVAAIVTPDGNYLLASLVFPQNWGTLGYGPWIAKVGTEGSQSYWESNGNVTLKSTINSHFSWGVEAISGLGYEEGGRAAMTLMSDVSVIVAGGFSFYGRDPGTGDTILREDSSIWMTRVDSSGKTMSTKFMGYVISEAEYLRYPRVLTLATASDGGYVVAGGGQYNRKSVNAAFVMRFKPTDPLGLVRAKDSSADMSVFPVPATNTLHLQYHDEVQPFGLVRLFNPLGIEVLRNEGSSTLDVSKLPRGAYYLEAIANGMQYYRSIILD